jgi:hypothetical protein
MCRQPRISYIHNDGVREWQWKPLLSLGFLAGRQWPDLPKLSWADLVMLLWFPAGVKMLSALSLTSKLLYRCFKKNTRSGKSSSMSSLIRMFSDEGVEFCPECLLRWSRDFLEALPFGCCEEILWTLPNMWWLHHFVTVTSIVLVVICRDGSNFSHLLTATFAFKMQFL